jgi:hypothetical protein
MRAKACAQLGHPRSADSRLVRAGTDTRLVTTVPNWLALVGLVVPAATGLVGYVLAGRNERARDERAAAREAIARRASVRERLDEQSHAFQRETLLELQDVLQRLMRCTSRVILHDRRTLKERGELTLVGEELDRESYEIGVAAQRLQERVLERALREAIGQFRSQVSTIQASFVFVSEMSAEDGIAHLESQLATLGEYYTAITHLVGTALRIELGWLPENE